MIKDISDLDEIGKDMIKVTEAMKTEIPNAMARFVWIIMAESAEECPHKIGNLRRSGSVDDPEVTSTGIAIGFGYGDAACDYALYVHENTQGYWILPTTKKALAFDAGGERVIVKKVWMPPNPHAKFLENPVLRHEGELPDYIDSEMARILGA